MAILPFAKVWPSIGVRVTVSTPLSSLKLVLIGRHIRPSS